MARDKRLALFDFDGTVIRGDSYQMFVRYTHAWCGYTLGLIVCAPSLIGWKIGLISPESAKRRTWRYFYRGWKAQELESKGRTFVSKVLYPSLISEAKERMMKHKADGHDIIIVSASMNAWLGPLAEKLEVDLCCTEYEVVEGIVTGEFKTPNCQGEEKLIRVSKRLQLQDYDYIYVYGDSDGDKAMFSIASEAHYRLF